MFLIGHHQKLASQQVPISKNNTSKRPHLRGVPGLTGSTHVVARPIKSITTSLTLTGTAGAKITRPVTFSSVVNTGFPKTLTDISIRSSETEDAKRENGIVRVCL